MYFPSGLNTGISSIPFTWNASPNPSVRKNHTEEFSETRGERNVSHFPSGLKRGLEASKPGIERRRDLDSPEALESQSSLRRRLPSSSIARRVKGPGRPSGEMAGSSALSIP